MGIKYLREKGEDAGYEHFLLFPKCFQKVHFQGRYKWGLFGKRLNGVCWVSLSEINDNAAESAEQDQTARMCRLILLYTLRKTVCHHEWQDTEQASYFQREAQIILFSR